MKTNVIAKLNRCISVPKSKQAKKWIEIKKKIKKSNTSVKKCGEKS